MLRRYDGNEGQSATHCSHKWDDIKIYTPRELQLALGILPQASILGGRAF